MKRKVDKFFVGLSLGIMAGVLLLDNSKDVKKMVDKGKDAALEKVESLKKAATKKS